MKKLFLKKLLKATVLIPLVMTVLVACVNPSNSSSSDDDKTDDFDVKYLDEKIEIYNKLLGEWERNVKCDYLESDWGCSSATTYVVHFEPKEIWVKDPAGNHNTCKTFEKPFYNYIYLPKEYDELSQKQLENIEYTKNYKMRDTEGFDLYRDTIYLEMGMIGGNSERYMLAVDQMDRGYLAWSVLGYSYSFYEPDHPKNYHLKKIGFNFDDEDDNKNKNPPDPSGVDFEIEGSYSFEIDGQANAASSVSFENGVITVQNKKTSNSRTADYVVSGNTVEITYSSYEPETFNINKIDDNTIELEYFGSEDTSFVCMMLFQDIYNKSLTLVKE